MYQKLKKNFFLLISTFLLIYFFFNLLGGERGFISYQKKKNILNDLEIQQTSLINEIKSIELKNSLLTNNLDLDFIETLIRDNFLFGKKGERIYIFKDDES
tara:strand:- start:640 stop:942 length:303 start_codon:yes stop_codon:yes gene_type:complete